MIFMIVDQLAIFYPWYLTRSWMKAALNNNYLVDMIQGGYNLGYGFTGFWGRPLFF
jgi:hypothetical protein